MRRRAGYGFRKIPWFLRTRGWIFLGLLLLPLTGARPQGVYSLRLLPQDQSPGFLRSLVAAPDSFNNLDSCIRFINRLPLALQQQGYLTASLDSVSTDSSRFLVRLFIGRKYGWTRLGNGNIPAEIRTSLGLKDPFLENRVFRYGELVALEERILDYCEDHGYPFASVRLDSIRIRKGMMRARIFLNEGFRFRIDTIIQRGRARLQPHFLERFLGISQGSLYDESRLRGINLKILSSSFLTQARPWNIRFMGDRTSLNLFLDNKSSNQFNVLVGFQPDNLQTGKLLLTGQATLHLLNSFGHGEGIDFNWQQLQYRSPQLNLAFSEPYLWNTPLGIDLHFDLYRQDSSYLKVQEGLGIRYFVSSRNYFRFFWNNDRNYLLTVDTLSVKSSRKLPQNIDVSQDQFGFSWSRDQTDHPLFPTRGYRLSFSLGAGYRRILKNNTILQLQQNDSSGTYSFASLYDSLPLKTYNGSLSLDASRYFRLGKSGVVLTGLQGAALLGKGFFLDELLRIGGYQILRGFDEQSIYASQYLVLTLEYRYLLSGNSYLFLFSDDAYVREKYLFQDSRDLPTGLGIGMVFQTRAGLFNLSFALGRRGQASFNPRQTKIHFGYLNYF